MKTRMLFLFFIVASACSVDVYAENEIAQFTASRGVISHNVSDTAAQSVAVTVRMIEALEPTKAGGALPVASQQLTISPGLEDIRPKLQKLQFSTFHLIDTFSEKVPMLQKAVIPLPRGESLTLRPLYARDERLGMWIRWRDAEGQEVLDTRMHFDYGESVITGTENDLNRGIVLAIDVKPVP